MRMVCFLLACLLAGPIVAVAQNDIKPAVNLVLELSDGSRIIGVPGISEFKMATDYADMDIPLPLLSTITLSGSGTVAKADFRNGDSLSGHLAITGIALKTVFGPVLIPIAEVSSIEIGGVAEPLPQGLVLHYTFDADRGDEVVDSSGSGINGKVHGATYSHDDKVGGVMSFNGDNQGILLGNPASLQMQDFTILCWVKRGDVNRATAQEGPDAVVFGYGIGGYILGLHPDGHLFLSKTNANAVFSDCAIEDDAFHQAGVTKQGGHVIFYLDGKPFPASDYDPGFEFNTEAAVGIRSDNMGNSFLGSIGEVEVFNRALTGDEVKGIYDGKK